MILNAYAVLGAFACVLRLVIGALAACLALRSLAKSPAAPGSAGREAAEGRWQLLTLLVPLLAGLTLASWPLLYLLWQSYVPQWSGVMCIYGVTRIGLGSDGPARFLPDLAWILQGGKPLLVFLGGAWLVVYRLNHAQGQGLLARQVLGLAALVGLLAVLEAGAELTYLLIPKQEQYLAAGCCTTVGLGMEDRFQPGAFLPEAGRAWLGTAFVAANLLAAAGLWFARRAGAGGSWFVLAAAGIAAATAVNALFLLDVAAPRLLSLPHHHCAYDLIGTAPSSLGAVALFVLAVLATGWGGVALACGRQPAVAALARGETQRWATCAMWGVAAASLWMSGELARADLTASGEGRCGWDGLPLTSPYSVRVERPAEALHFCGVSCAQHWLRRDERPVLGVYVQDEPSGVELAVDAAWFVRSAVITNPATNNRIHVFANRAAALRHAEAHRGVLLTEQDRPFARLVEKPARQSLAAQQGREEQP